MSKFQVVSTNNTNDTCNKCKGDTEGKTIVVSNTGKSVTLDKDLEVYCKPCTVDELKKMTS